MLQRLQERGITMAILSSDIGSSLEAFLLGSAAGSENPDQTVARVVDSDLLVLGQAHVLAGLAGLGLLKAVL